MKYKILFKSISVFFVMLMLSMVVAPVVSAQAEQQKMVSLEIEIAAVMDSAVILKDDAESKIAAVEQENGSVLYAMSWNDSNIEGRVNFMLISEDDLISEGYLKSKIADADFIIASVTRASASFWNGSYAQTYGNSLTGGVQIHFSQRDAVMVTNVGSAAAPAIGTAIGSVVPGLGTSAGLAVGTAIAVLVPVYYWSAQNSDGSLDVKISYIVINAIAYSVPGVGHFIMFGRIYHYFK